LPYAISPPLPSRPLFSFDQETALVKDGRRLLGIRGFSGSRAWTTLHGGIDDRRSRAAVCTGNHHGAGSRKTAQDRQKSSLQGRGERGAARHQNWAATVGPDREIVRACADQYREDVWTSQPYRPEVWIEKDALTGVIEGVSEEFRVPWFSCRGNVSDSEMYAAGKRFARIVGQVPIVLHLGDHDPNGLDMTRDIQDRLVMFARREIRVQRLALNLDQTDGLPPNFAKETDSRFASYVQQFGTTDCWELDALAPNVISNLVRAGLERLIDPGAWADAIACEDDNRSILTSAAGNRSLVKAVLSAAP
jgi:hypothetical protein